MRLARILPNIGLVIGITALLTPLRVRSRTLKREFLILFAVLVLAGVLLLDQYLSRIDGVILMIGFGVLMALMCAIAFDARRVDPLAEEFAQEIPQSMNTIVAVIWLLIGLLVLLLSSRVIVWGAIEIARTLGVSDLIIGLTIVAVGTSLPELAASVMSAFKGEPDIAIGNVIGSNMFNLLPVLALPALIAPGVVPVDVDNECGAIFCRLRFPWTGAYQSMGRRAVTTVFPRLPRILVHSCGLTTI